MGIIWGLSQLFGVFLYFFRFAFMHRIFPIRRLHSQRDNNFAIQIAAAQFVSVSKLAVQMSANPVSSVDDGPLDSTAHVREESNAELFIKKMTH